MSCNENSQFRRDHRWRARIAGMTKPEPHHARFTLRQLFGLCTFICGVMTLIVIFSFIAKSQVEPSAWKAYFVHFGMLALLIFGGRLLLNRNLPE